MDHEGILSVDLLLATFMLLIIIVSTSTLISDRFSMVENSKEVAEARSLAENIAGTINQVYAGGDGHVIKIRTPAQINNYNYSVTVSSSGVLVKVGGWRGFADIIPQKISNATILKSSTVTLNPARNYVILNKREGNGENWIVIMEN